MSDQNAFEVETENHDADSTFYDTNTITTSFEHLDISIDDATSKKKSLASALDLVMCLMKEVELKEKAAEEAKAEAATSGLDILAKVEELKQEQQCIKEANDMEVTKVLQQKVVLANKIKKLQCRVFGVMNDGDKCLGHFDEMRKELDLRLTSAIREKELADKEKLEKETLAQEALAFEESRMLKLVEESKTLKQEAMKISTLQDFLQQHEFDVNILHGDVSDKYEDIKLLRECLEHQPVLQPSELLLSSQTSSILPLSSSLTSSLVPGHELKTVELNESTPEETDDEPVLFDDEFSFPENELLNLAFKKQEGNMNGSTESFVAPAQTFVECEAAPITVKHYGKKERRQKSEKNGKKDAPCERITNEHLFRSEDHRRKKKVEDHRRKKKGWSKDDLNEIWW